MPIRRGNARQRPSEIGTPRRSSPTSFFGGWFYLSSPGAAVLSTGKLITRHFFRKRLLNQDAGKRRSHGSNLAIGVQTFGESKVRRDREHGDRQTTVEVDPPDLLEVIGVGTREILQVKTGSFEIELAAERKEAGDVHLARGKQARVIQRVVADFHRKPCRVLSCLGEDITPAPRADSRC